MSDIDEEETRRIEEIKDMMDPRKVNIV